MVTNEDFNSLVDTVNELAERVDALELPPEQSDPVRKWVETQIALQGGQYVSEDDE